MDAALARVLQPNWFPAPDCWFWRRPDGVRQGFGLTWRGDPGMANLLWLALDLERPPTILDARRIPLYSWLLLHGQPLASSASILTLAQWTRDLGMSAVLPNVRRIPQFQQLLNLAEKRLHHAHT